MSNSFIVSLAAMTGVLATVPAMAQTSATATGTAGANVTSGTTTSNTGLNATVTPGSANWNNENTYWQSQYNTRPYYKDTNNYSVYEPAYRYGVEMYNRNPTRSFNDLSQSELERGWTQARGNSNLSWNEARSASQDSYMRLYDNSRASGSSTTTIRR